MRCVMKSVSTSPSAAWNVAGAVFSASNVSVQLPLKYTVLMMDSSRSLSVFTWGSMVPPVFSEIHAAMARSVASVPNSTENGVA